MLVSVFNYQRLKSESNLLISIMPSNITTDAIISATSAPRGEYKAVIIYLKWLIVIFPHGQAEQQGAPLLAEVLRGKRKAPVSPGCCWDRWGGERGQDWTSAPSLQPFSGRRLLSNVRHHRQGTHTDVLILSVCPWSTQGWQPGMIVKSWADKLGHKSQLRP